MADPLSLLHAVVIGLVEGLTEFLPISSTAHMEIVPQLLSWGDPGTAFSAVIQLGPIVAIIIYFWADILRYVKGIFRTVTPFNIPKEDQDARLGWCTIMATLPILLLGKVLEKKIDSDFRSLTVIATSLIVFGFILALAESVAKRKKTLDDMNGAEAAIIGFAQCLALVPGASRSGVTMSAALFRGFDREAATRFSFLLSIPAITAAGVYKFIKEVLHSPDLKEMLLPYAVGTLVAGLSAYAVIHWFLGFVRRHNTNVFVIYRVILGIALLLLIRSGKLDNSTAAQPVRAITVPTR